MECRDSVTLGVNGKEHFTNMFIWKSKYFSIYTVDSPRVGGSGRKFFICERMGHGGKGICHNPGMQMYYFNLQEMAAHCWSLPSAFLSASEAVMLSPGGRSKSISIPLCWRIKVVIYHTSYHADGGAQLGSSLGTNFFKSKGLFNHAPVEFYQDSVATEEGCWDYKGYSGVLCCA